MLGRLNNTLIIDSNSECKYPSSLFAAYNLLMFSNSVDLLPSPRSFNISPAVKNFSGFGKCASVTKVDKEYW